MNLQQRRTATKVVFGTLVGIVFLVTAGFVIRFVISSTIISSAKGQAKIIIEQAKKQAESEKSRVESETRDAELRRTETIKALDKQISDTGAELRNRDEAISVRGQQLKELEEKVANVSANSNKNQQIKDYDQQIKDRDQKLKDSEQQRKDLEAKIQKLSQQTPITPANNRDQELKDGDQKIKDLEARVQKLNQQLSNIPKTPLGGQVDEVEAGMNFVKVLNQSINPLIAQINSHPAFTYNISTIGSARLSQVNYNRQLVQGALKNCQWLLWNLGSIENQKGKKYRAYVAQSASRISEPVAFDIKYDYHGSSVRFNREILNHILVAASDENVDMMTLNKTFQDSFNMFMNPHFVDMNQIDDWQLSETIAIADKQLYSLYHH